jgi:hypothetical protein
VSKGKPFQSVLVRADDPATRQEWARLCAGSQQSTVFASLTFGEVLSEAVGLPLRIGLVLQDGQPRAGSLIYLKRRGPYLAASHPVLSPIHSPVLAGVLSEAELHYSRSPLDALLDLVETEVDQATFALHPSLTDARPFQWHGWRVRPGYTYRLALDPERASTAGWSDSHLQIARSQRHLANELELAD